MPATNPYSAFASGPQAPALYMIAITPSDSDDLSIAIRQIYIGVGGNVTVVDTAGNTVTHINVAQGGYIGPFSVARVKATGTTATNLVGYV
jgi:hypothetical protein